MTGSQTDKAGGVSSMPLMGTAEADRVASHDTVAPVEGATSESEVGAAAANVSVHGGHQLPNLWGHFYYNCVSCTNFQLKNTSL